MAAIAMGKKWKDNLISSADREYEEALKRRKKLTRVLVDAVSDMRGGANAAHDAAVAYMAEKGASKKELAGMLNCTPAEARLIFDEGTIAQFDIEENDETVNDSEAGITDDSASDDDGNRQADPAVDEPGYGLDETGGEPDAVAGDSTASQPTGYAYATNY